MSKKLWGVTAFNGDNFYAVIAEDADDAIKLIAADLGIVGDLDCLTAEPLEDLLYEQYRGVALLCTV